MMKYFIFSVLFFAHTFSVGQSRTLSLGLFTGITSTFSVDQGINADSRYHEKYDLKFAPFGLEYGMDYEGFGFVISPGIIHIGQNFYVINTSGGQEGQRKINQHYFNIPAAFKLHIIDLSFFKISFLGGASFAYLTKGTELISHEATKLKFEPEVYPILPPDYTIVYDGVLVPKVDDYKMVTKRDFNPYQIFVLAGFRSDWDMTDAWRMSIDFRVNYGILEPRSDSYVKALDDYQELYALPGKRKDTFAQFTVGFSRYIILEKKDKERKKQIKNTSRKYKPQKYPWPSPRKSKPKE
jgi:hypothetical protein